MKPLITIDIDDVLADSTDHLRLRVNVVVNVQLTKEHYSVAGEYWGYYEGVWKTAGIDHLVNFKELNKEMVVNQSDVAVMAQARDVLVRLSNSYRFALVTSRDTAWKNATKVWVRDNFGDIFEGLYFVEHRSGEHGDKGSLCKELGAVLHIDDNVGHCRTVIAQGISTILFGTYGWHQDIPDGQVHCKDWNEVEVYLESAKL